MMVHSSRVTVSPFFVNTMCVFSPLCPVMPVCHEHLHKRPVISHHGYMFAYVDYTFSVRQGLKNRVLASPKASSYIIGLVATE